jgi:YVTN family beta-propeller protein
MKVLLNLFLILSPVAIAQAQPLVYVPNASSGSISVIDTATDHVIATFPSLPFPVRMIISPDGARAYVNNLDTKITILDTFLGSLIGFIPLTSAPVDFALSPDGSRIYAIAVAPTGAPASVLIIDTASESVSGAVQVGVDAFKMVSSADGSRIYVANAGDNTVSVIDTASITLAGTIPMPLNYSPRGLAISPDGTRLYAALELTLFVPNSPGEPVVTIDTASNTILRSTTVGFGVEHLVVTPDGARVYVANASTKSLLVIDASNGSVVDEVNLHDQPDTLAITPDGTRIFVAEPFRHFTAQPKGSLDQVAVVNTLTNHQVDSITTAISPTDLALASHFPPDRIFVDILPGTFPNTINPKSSDPILVVVLSSASFDATLTVDRASLAFGHTGSEMSLIACNPDGQDINADGIPDLVCLFDPRKTLLQTGDIQGIMTGSTITGGPLRGVDSLRIVPSS